MRGWLRRASAGWQRVARRIGEFQARVVLSALYIVLILPVGCGLRLLADPLRRRRPAATNWTPRPAAAPTLEESRRQ